MASTDLILAGTGHRPEELGGYNNRPAVEEYAEEMLIAYRPTKLILGMALGWDQALAFGAIKLNIPFVAACPFKGQEIIWPEALQFQYHYLLGAAAEVVIVCEGGYAPWKMQKRNEWMVDHCDKLLALWNGVKEGGTYNCVKYAEKVKRPILNVWPGWESRAA